MPLGNRQVELHAFGPSDWDPKSSRLAIEPIRLVLGLQHGPPHVRDGGPSPSFQTTAVGVQDRQCDLERGRDVLLVYRVARAQVFVRGPRESSAGSNIVPQGDPNRFVHEEAKLREEPTETGILQSDRKDKGSVGEHVSPLGKRPASRYLGEVPECENPDSEE